VSLVAVTPGAGGVVVVALDDAPRYNALSGTMVTELREAFARLSRDPGIRSLVLRGSGRGFCAGADLSQGATNEPVAGSEGRGKVGRLQVFQENLSELIVAIRQCTKPSVAAVHGAAVGGGFALALACDVRLCSPEARFGLRPIRMGLSSCELGATYLLPRMLGSGRATELMLTGRDLGAAEAERIGLVHRVVEREQLVESATDVARKLRANEEDGADRRKVALHAGVEATGLRHALAPVYAC
jgi:enoyl-CoA hydratase